MFQNWGFLITEMIGLIIVAALLGLFVGWIIWGRRTVVENTEEADRLRGELDACHGKCSALEAELATATVVAARPEKLVGPRGGTPDDLKRIKGIGPKLEQLCFSLGFYHFDQIAGWTGSEVSWVDQNLAEFKGRVTRDDWVAQAKILAAGGETEFAKRVDEGDVTYET